jgi:hypothetical protein
LAELSSSPNEKPYKSKGVNIAKRQEVRGGTSPAHTGLNKTVPLKVVYLLDIRRTMRTIWARNDSWLVNLLQGDSNSRKEGFPLHSLRNVSGHGHSAVKFPVCK